MGFEFFGQEEEGVNKSQSLYSSMAKMEIRSKEYDRARVIYKVSPGSSPVHCARTHTTSPLSSLWIAFLAPSLPSSTPPTARSRSSSETATESRRPCSESVVSNTRRSSRTSLATMMSGSTTLDWRRTRTRREISPRRRWRA